MVRRWRCAESWTRIFWSRCGKRALATDGVSAIDLSAVTRVDTAGLALLVHFIALVRRQGGEAKLTGKSENLQTLVRLYNLPADMIP